MNGEKRIVNIGMREIILTLAMLLITCYLLPGQSGMIRELSGTVELKNPESAVFVPASVGQQLGEETVISTAFKSTALLEIGNSLVLVRPLTRLTLTEISSSSGMETLNVNLQAGRLRVDINPPAGTRASMSVMTPMSVSSVRGTSFEVDTRNLRVISGTVGFIGTSGQMVSIGSGFNIGIGEEGIARNPIGASPASLMPQQPPGADQNTEPVTVAVISDNQDSGGTGFEFRW